MRPLSMSRACPKPAVEITFNSIVEGLFNERGRPHNRWGRVKRFIECIYYRFGLMRLRSRWIGRPMKAALEYGQKVAGISSLSAARDIERRYREGSLRNPLEVRPQRPKPVLDQHRDYLVKNTQTKWQ